jgi:hypothetical protein
MAGSVILKILVNKSLRHSNPAVFRIPIRRPGCKPGSGRIWAGRQRTSGKHLTEGNGGNEGGKLAKPWWLSWFFGLRYLRYLLSKFWGGWVVEKGFTEETFIYV